jgi:hypothetical protein
VFGAVGRVGWLLIRPGVVVVVGCAVVEPLHETSVPDTKRRPPPKRGPRISGDDLIGGTRVQA